MTKIQIALVVFLVVLLLANILVGRVHREKEEIARRVRMVTGESGAEKKAKDEKIKKKPLSGLTELFRLFTPKHVLRKVEADLIQADFPLKAEEMILANLGIAVFFSHPLGLILVGSAIFSELIGILAIKRIVNIEL